jgi:hypothetical protein
MEGKRGRCIGITTLPPSCAKFSRSPVSLRTCPGLHRDSFNLYPQSAKWADVVMYFASLVLSTYRIKY